MELTPDELAALMGDAAFEAIAVLEGMTIVGCNAALAELVRAPREAIVGRSVLDLAAPEDHARVEAAVRGERSEPYAATLVRADGTRLVGEARGRRVLLHGHVLRVTALRDRTAELAAADELRRSEAKYRRLFDAIADGILVMGRDAMPRDVNLRLCEMLGRTREEVLAMNPSEAIDDLEHNPMRLERLAVEPRYSVERRLKHADGSLVDVEVHLTALTEGEIVAVIRDISERKRAAAQEGALRDRLQQSQRLEALGRLAGGVAHDFNNLLTVILGGAEGLRAAGADARSVEEIVDAAQRGAELTAQLLSFSRHRPRKLERLDAVAHVERLAPLLRRLLGPDHPLVLHAGPEPAPVLADPGQLTQVVMNLALNARDAMPRGGMVALRVHARRSEGGGDVQIEVADTGPGIPDEVRAQIFEPFFTTKPAGEGTGLGLSTVYGNVAAWGGEVRFESSAKGSCFQVVLPRASDEEPSAPARAPARALRVLLVDDHPAVRRAVHALLRGVGHDVIEAGGVTEALAIIDGGEPFDLVLSDVVMADGSGVTLLERVVDRPVVLMSGYPRAELAGERAEARLLAKPFGAAELIAALEEAMLRPR